MSLPIGVPADTTAPVATPPTAVPSAVPAGAAALRRRLPMLMLWVLSLLAGLWAGLLLPTSFHVVGTQFDTGFKEGAYVLAPGNPQHGGAQALDLTPGQGGFVEFVAPAPGRYPFVDHAMVDAEHGAHGAFVAGRR